MDPGFEYGWPGFFRILRLYLAYFRGQSSAATQFMGAAPEPRSEAWAALAGGLGLTGATVGGQAWIQEHFPALSGDISSLC